MKAKLVALIVSVVAMAGLADAAARAPRVRPPRAKVREGAQADRIRDGVKDGSLTKGETGKLIQEQKKVRDMAKDVTSDGEVTLKEKALLDRAQDKASADIFGERHDAEGTMGPVLDPDRWKVWSPGVNARERNQALRIAQGIRSGSLTADETKTLLGMEADIRKTEREMKSDGVLTLDERKTLHQELNEASKAIFDLKHDGDRVWHVRPLLLAKIEKNELTEAEAKELLAQLHRLSQIVRLLGGAPLSAERRAQLEAEYAQLASQLFES
jgi:hypothetical protein